MAIRCSTGCVAPDEGAAHVLNKNIGLESIMRTLYVFALAAAASFATLSPAAAQEPATAGTPSTTVQVTGVPGARYKVDSEELAVYRGTYLLSDGRVMVVRNRGKRFFAEIDGDRRAELIPVGPRIFVAPERDVIMMFDEVYNGRLNDVVIRPRRQIG